MLNAFGIFQSTIGMVLVLWFFIIGFWVKRIIKELAETNRLLREIAGGGPTIVTVPKAS